ncbi:amino acid racemase [Gammaproteobacteria bacterium]|nr:amino acid racemase [Gammaproteobacteria bacterium]
MIKPTWDENEKTIGVLGLAPYASLDFYKKVLDATSAQKDWHHARLILDSNPKIPSRGRYFDLGEENPAPYIYQAIMDLLNNGADFVCIPCNTAHYFYEEFAKNLKDKVPNIIEITNQYIRLSYPKIKTIGLLASKATVQYKLYGKFSSGNRFNILTPKSDQYKVGELIERIKQGDTGPSTIKSIKGLADSLQSKGAECIVLGCTELSMILTDGDLSIPVIDSNAVYAKYAIDRAQNKI